MCEMREYMKENMAEVFLFMEHCLPESGRIFEPEGRHYVYKNIQENFLKFWCMYDGDKIIGTVAVRDLGDGKGEIKSLYLLNAYQGQGLGRKLFALAIQEAIYYGFKELYLDTIGANSKRAIEMYKRAGFTETEKYNDNPVADVFMKLVL